MFVSTAMTGNVRSSFFIRTPISFARAAVATIGIQKKTFGCFPHALQVSVVVVEEIWGLQPLWIFSNSNVVESENKR